MALGVSGRHTTRPWTSFDQLLGPPPESTFLVIQLCSLLIVSSSVCFGVHLDLIWSLFELLRSHVWIVTTLRTPSTSIRKTLKLSSKASHTLDHIESNISSYLSFILNEYCMLISIQVI